MSYPDKPEIIVPNHWNAEKDFDHYVDTFGDGGEPLYLEAIWRIRASSNELADVIAFAVQSLTGGKGGTSALRLVSLTAQLELLQKIVDRKTSGEIRDRLLGDLTRCYAVLRLRDDILTRHLLKPESVWLFELGGTSDWIVTAWSILRESLQIELGLPPEWRPSGDTWLDWYE